MKTWLIRVLWLFLPVMSLHAQTPIRIGEINSYSAMPQFTQPYKQGWQLAIEEINVNLSGLDRIANSNAAASEEMTASVISLSNSADATRREVARFKLQA